MATYCIGDVQGSYVALRKLLDTVHYDASCDSLWFVGDLVNRGLQSLEVLRFLHKLPNVNVVLGNHDLHLIALMERVTSFAAASLQPVLDAPDGRKLVEWLRMQHLVYYDKERACILVHAGIYPGWDLQEALNYSAEVSKILHGTRNTKYYELLRNMYGNTPALWQDSLSGWDRMRFIINAFTRMRFCDLDGNLEFNTSSAMQFAPTGYLPWFKIPWRKTQGLKIIFGHWASLMGNTNEPETIALDTGYIWGGELTALRLEDSRMFSVRSGVVE